jgi:hypothetical protein
MFSQIVLASPVEIGSWFPVKDIHAVSHYIKSQPLILDQTVQIKDSISHCSAISVANLKSDGYGKLLCIAVYCGKSSSVEIDLTSCIHPLSINFFIWEHRYACVCIFEYVIWNNILTHYIKSLNMSEVHYIINRK